jgi:hypothetical protein
VLGRVEAGRARADDRDAQRCLFAPNQTDAKG